MSLLTPEKQDFLMDLILLGGPVVK